MLTGGQIRAGRALVRWSADQLAASAGITRNTVQRIEASDGMPPATLKTIAAIQKALEAAGVEFIPGGVRLGTAQVEAP